MNTIATYIRRRIYAILYAIDRMLGRKTKLAILCYHSISDNQWRFSISFREFKSQIEYLAANYDFITLGDVEAVIRGTKKLDRPSIAITFDDGYKDLVTIKEVLKQFDIKPTLFVLSEPDNANREELGTNKELMTDLDLLEMKTYGCSIGSHTATHMNLKTADAAQTTHEVTDSKRKLEADMNEEIPYIAYPRGKYTEATIAEVRSAGYRMGLTMDDGTIDTKTDLLRVPRIGVDQTHSYQEFPAIMSPSAIAFRKFIKHSFLGAYL